MDKNYNILQIIPATDGWYALYDPVLSGRLETGAPDKYCYADAVACWVLVEMTDHNGVEHRWVDGLGESCIISYNQIDKYTTGVCTTSVCSEEPEFRKFIYDPARTRVLRSQFPKVEYQKRRMKDEGTNRRSNDVLRHSNS